MKDLTNLKTFIIDSENPHEIDDAISFEEVNNIKLIWIHISYPAKLFEYNSTIDNEARNKSSSLYLIDKYIPMLPQNVIEESNLKQNKLSETLSICLELNDNGSIKNYKLIEAIIKPNYEFTYEDVNEVLDLEPPEEYELIELNRLLKKSFNYRKLNGAIIFNNNYSKIKFNNNLVTLEKIEISDAHKLVSEAMIIMGSIISDYLSKNKVPAPFRSQKINCDYENILLRNFNSPVKYIILKQYIGKSSISTIADKHETLGLNSYVQSTSPLRRYLDLIVQRQVLLHLNKNKVLDEKIILDEIHYSKSKQRENNNIIKENKLFYLRKFFIKNDIYKIIFIRWINHKKHIALVYFPDLFIEQLIILFTSVETYTNKIYKIKYNHNNHSNLLEFIN